MRTRRSRFFVILLHVVGVSHSSLYHWSLDNHHTSNHMNISSSSSSTSRLVEPNAIALQYIDFYEELLLFHENQNKIYHQNTHPKWKFWKSIRRKQRIEQFDDDDDDESVTTAAVTPIWLQDPIDGLCLGPMSIFSECGDATLWYVTIQYDLPPSNRLELLSGIPTPSIDNSVTTTTTNSNNNHSLSELNQTATIRIRKPINTRIGLTFRVVDQDFEMSGTTTIRKNTSQTRRRKRHEELSDTAECLDADLNHLSVHVRHCRCRGGYIWQRKRVRSSVWTVNTNGILQPFETIITTTTTTTAKSKLKRVDSIPKEMEDISLCLTRNTTRAVLANCETHNPIQFLFLRYHTIPALSTASLNTNKVDRRKQNQYAKVGKPQQQPQHHEPSISISDVLLDSISSTTVISAQEENQDMKKGSDPAHLSTMYRDRPHDPVTIGPLMHPELKIASRLIFKDQSNVKRSKDTHDKNAFKPSPFAVALSNTNPILLANLNKNNIDGSTSASPSKNPSKMIYPTAVNDDITNLKVSKLRRMQTHPYLNEAKDGIWTDPQTNLQYNTDLCHYLGRNRQEHGRHTLTGFGIYRKGYVIKVYGIAYYVSKRDVLTDPALEPYATMTAEQLRSRPDFYEVLRTMRDSSSSSSTRKAGYFDRTIMLKTNMQLSTETMRSSLEADWSYLTDEAKRTLVDASMQEQVADDAMLEFIQSPDNPSRCSCSQVAPPEYKANPDCCARGTELVFTWTKANELEVRLNGRLMDIFPRPDIAEGIFYEYLRYDNPISPEFVDRVVDGFPFLLGPLAQIRGIHIGQSSSTKGTTNENAVLSAMTGFRDFVMSQTIAMSEATKQNMFEAADHVGNMSKIFAETAMDMAKEADRRRDLFVKHAVAAPEVFMKLVARDEETIQYFVRWMSGQPESEILGLDNNSEDSAVVPKPRGPRGRTFGYPLSRWFGEDIYYSPDEIEPMTIHPTINRVILTLVHLYLLLLFIVSFPGSYSTRTKILHRRYHHHREPSLDDSDSDTISDYDTNSNATIIKVSDGSNKGNNKSIHHDTTGMGDDDSDIDGVDQVLRQYDQQLKYPYSIQQFQKTLVVIPSLATTTTTTITPITRIRTGVGHMNTTNSIDRSVLQYTTTTRTQQQRCPSGEYTTSNSTGSSRSNSTGSGMKKKSLSYFL